MIDPLTAFSAAGNTLQFAELGIKIVLKAVEYANGGGDIEYQKLHDLTQQLAVSNAHLHEALTEITAKPLPPGPARALHYANEECLAVAQEFLIVLNELKFNRSRSPWRSVMLSLKSIKSKSDIEKIAAKVGAARSNLVLSLLVYLQTEVSYNTEAFTKDHQEIIAEARKVTKQSLAIRDDIAKLNTRFGDLKLADQSCAKTADDNRRHGRPSQSDAKGLDVCDEGGHDGEHLDDDTVQSDLSSFKVDGPSNLSESLELFAKDNIIIEMTEEERKEEQRKMDELKEKKKRKQERKEEQRRLDERKEEKDKLFDVTTMIHDNLKDVTRRLSDVLGRLDHDYAVVSSSFQDLSPLLDREVWGRRRVLDSLYYEKMNDRRDRITRAHNQTFHWIFRKSKSEQNMVWDDFFDWLCNQEHRSTYWIFGKPGCGKTTMIRELDENITEQSQLQQWTKGQDLLKLSCYFWCAGTAEQKSLMGFLRSLLHQLFQQRPDLINKVLKPASWNEALMPQIQLRPWEELELVRTIHDILRATTDCKILMFVDGLDEFDGDDEAKSEFLDLLDSLTAYSHVKACVASRYWNVFRDRLGSCPKVRLEDLTINDITIYVREKLGEDVWFRKEQKRWELKEHSDLLDKITGEMVEKARGVFLWVRLAVRDLLKVLRDGGRHMHLFRELNNMPPDLDDYFARMMRTVDPSYRKDASIILQTALCDMDYSPVGCKTLISGPDLLLVHLDLLEEQPDPCFAIKSQMQLIDYINDEENIDEMLEHLERRLMSRCMGLLEIDTPYQWACKVDKHPWATKIEFLHRTVKDFLLKQSTQKVLREYSDGDFDAHLFRCNTLVANISMMADENGQELRFRSFACFFRQILERPNHDEAAVALIRRMTQLLQSQAVELNSFAEQSSYPHIRADESFVKLIRSFSNAESVTCLRKKFEAAGFVELSKLIEPGASTCQQQHREILSAPFKKRPREKDRLFPEYLDDLAQPLLDAKHELLHSGLPTNDDDCSDDENEVEYFDVFETHDEEPIAKRSKFFHELDATDGIGDKAEVITID